MNAMKSMRLQSQSHDLCLRIAFALGGGCWRQVTASAALTARSRADEIPYSSEIQTNTFPNQVRNAGCLGEDGKGLDGGEACTPGGRAGCARDVGESGRSLPAVGRDRRADDASGVERRGQEHRHAAANAGAVQGVICSTAFCGAGKKRTRTYNTPMVALQASIVKTAFRSIPLLGMVRDGIHVGSLGQQLDESGRTNNAQTAGFDLANASTVNQAPNLIPQPKSSRSAPRMPKNEGSDAL